MLLKALSCYEIDKNWISKKKFQYLGIGMKKDDNLVCQKDFRKIKLLEIIWRQPNFILLYAKTLSF